jgi:Zn-dependent peptidase ImmA (M78 family)
LTTKLTKEEKAACKQEISPIVNAFREDVLGIDPYSPIKDTFESIEQLGYFIVRFKADQRLSGYHTVKNNVDCIFINSAHSLGRQFYSAWHECYHAYTGDIGGVSLSEASEYDRREFKANCFATNILMPEELIKKYVTDELPNELTYVSYKDLIKMQAFFRVSYSSLIFRIIEFYPQYESTLKRRLGIASKSRELEFQEKTLEYGGEIQLIMPTNEADVTPKYYELLQDNFKAGRISEDRLQKSIELIEEAGKKHE